MSTASPSTPPPIPNASSHPTANPPPSASLVSVPPIPPIPPTNNPAIAFVAPTATHAVDTKPLPVMAPLSKPPVPPRKLSSGHNRPLVGKVSQKLNATKPPRPPAPAPSPSQQQPQSHHVILGNAQQPAKNSGEIVVTDTPMSNATSQEKDGERERPSNAAKKSVADARAALKQQQAASRAADASALAAEKAAFDKLIENAAAGLTSNIRSIEKDIETLEEEYITSTWSHGNVLRGWDGFVRRVDRSERIATGTGSGTATGAPKYRKSRPSDRIFSLSSSTSKFRKENPDVQIQKRPPDKKKKKKR